MSDVELQDFECIGFLTRDPIRRYTKQDPPHVLVELELRIPRPRPKEGAPLKKELYLDFVCWDAVAEQAYAGLQKGTRVWIKEAFLERHAWKDALGRQHNKLRVVVIGFEKAATGLTLEQLRNRQLPLLGAR